MPAVGVVGDPYSVRRRKPRKPPTVPSTPASILGGHEVTAAHHAAVTPHPVGSPPLSLGQRRANAAQAVAEYHELTNNIIPTLEARLTGLQNLAPGSYQGQPDAYTPSGVKRRLNAARAHAASLHADPQVRQAMARIRFGRSIPGDTGLGLIGRKEYEKQFKASQDAALQSERVGRQTTAKEKTEPVPGGILHVVSDLAHQVPHGPRHGPFTDEQLTRLSGASDATKALLSRDQKRALAKFLKPKPGEVRRQKQRLGEALSSGDPRVPGQLPARLQSPTDSVTDQNPFEQATFGLVHGPVDAALWASLALPVAGEVGAAALAGRAGLRAAGESLAESGGARALAGSAARAAPGRIAAAARAAPGRALAGLRGFGRPAAAAAGAERAGVLDRLANLRAAGVPEDEALTAAIRGADATEAAAAGRAGLGSRLRTSALGRGAARAGRGAATAGRGAAAVGNVVAKPALYPVLHPLKFARYAAIAQAPVAAVHGGNPLEQVATTGGVLGQLPGAVVGDTLKSIPAGLEPVVKDILDLPAQVIPSIYLPLAGMIEYAKGDPERINSLWSSYMATGIIPGVVQDVLGTQEGQSAIDRLREHPVLGLLELAGAKAVVGRGVGGALRRGAAGERGRAWASPLREPLQRGGGAEPIERGYSLDAFNMAAQKALDRRRARKNQGQQWASPNQAERAGLKDIDRYDASAQLYSRGMRDVRTGEGVAATPKGEANQNAVLLAIKGIISRDHFHGDLTRYRTGLDREAQNLQHRIDTDTTLNPVKVRDYRDRIKQNRNLAHTLGEIQKHGDPDAIFAAARAHVHGGEHGLRALDAEMERLGIIDPAQAAQARMIEAAVIRLGAEHGIPNTDRLRASVAEAKKREGRARTARTKSAKAAAAARTNLRQTERAAAGSTFRDVEQADLAAQLPGRQESVKVLSEQRKAAVAGRKEAERKLAKRQKKQTKADEKLAAQQAVVARVAKAAEETPDESRVGPDYTPEVAASAFEVQAARLKSREGKPGITIEPSFNKAGDTWRSEPGDMNVVYRNEKGEPVGMIGVELKGDGSVGQISVQVKPGFRRQGIARKMIQAAIDAGMPVERLADNTFSAQGAALRENLIAEASAKARREQARLAAKADKAEAKVKAAEGTRDFQRGRAKTALAELRAGARALREAADAAKREAARPTHEHVAEAARAYERAQAERSIARNRAKGARADVVANKRSLRKFKPGSARLLDPETGQPLNRENLEARLRESGVNPEDIGFVTSRPGARGPGSYHRSYQANRNTISGQELTGAAARQGAIDFSHDAIIEHKINRGTLIDSVKNFDGAMDLIGIKPNPGATPHEWTDRARANDAALHPEQFGIDRSEKLVVLRKTPLGTSKELAFKIGEAQKAGKEPADPQLAQDTDTIAIDPNKGISASLWDRAVGDGDGPFIIARKSQVDRLRDQAAHAGAVTKAVQAFTQAWKRSILSTSPSWVPGNFADINLRLGLSRSNPYGFASRNARRFWRSFERQHGKEATMRLQARLRPGMQFGQVGATRKFRGPQQMEGSPTLRTAAEYGSTARHTQPVEGLVDAYVRSTDWWFEKNNSLIEQRGQDAGLGLHMQKEISARMGKWQRAWKMTDKAIDDYAAGMTNTASQIRAAEAVEQITGKWTALSPGARKVLVDWLPFGQWTRNALKFAYITLPAHHPIATALAATAYEMTAEERDKLGLSWFAPNAVPGYAQGSIPTAGGGLIPVGKFTTFGTAGDVPRTLSQGVLSQFDLDALAGIDWKGQPLVHSDGSPITEPHELILHALGGTFASMVPGLPLATRFADQGPIALSPIKPIDPDTANYLRSLKGSGFLRYPIKGLQGATSTGWSAPGDSSTPGGWSAPTTSGVSGGWSAP